MNKKILVMPAFQNREEFIRTFYRFAWYAGPQLDRIGLVTMFYAGDDIAAFDISDFFNNPEAYRPDDFAEDITKIIPAFRDRVMVVPDEDGLVRAGFQERFNMVYCWNIGRPAERLQARAYAAKSDINCLEIDPATERGYTSLVVSGFGQFNDAEATQRIKTYSARFKELAAEYKGVPVNLYGSGPSIDDLVKREGLPKDGISIVCNNGVANETLMERLKPEILTAGDPVYFPGVSLHAGIYRDNLVRTMRRYGSYFITDYYLSELFRQIIPDDLHDRVIGVPSYLCDPNINLLSRFQSSNDATNVLTMFMLPVAFSLSKNVRLMGFDNRPFGNQGKFFWGYAKGSSVSDKVMDSLYSTSPSYFYDYDANTMICHLNREIEQFLKLAEYGGAKVEVLTPSYTPALAKRFTEVPDA